MIDTILTFINGIILKGNAKSAGALFGHIFLRRKLCPV